MFLAKGLQLRDSEMRRFLQVELTPPTQEKQKQGWKAFFSVNW